MKVLLINSVYGYGSTGRICADIADSLTSDGHECFVAYGRGNVPDERKANSVRIGNNLAVGWHAMIARLLDLSGFGSVLATKKFIKWIKAYDPDIIHLHNIHGYFLNIHIFFDYLRSADKQVVWTLHDCWAFTGHCAHFEDCGCERWKTACLRCPQKREYPSCVLFGRSKKNFILKKKAFSGLKKMLLVTPSRWLAERTSESFLAEYPVKVIRNGIDLSLFKPTVLNEQLPDLETSKILLGAANVWSEKKGLYNFFDLANVIGNEYRLVLLGVSDEQQGKLPSNIVGIPRTDSIEELVSWYSKSDIFLHFSHEDTFPTVCLEAQACGTPVLTYRIGGCPETISAETGVVLEKTTNAENALAAVNEMLKAKNADRLYTAEQCISHAASFNKANMVRQYLNLYEDCKR